MSFARTIEHLEKRAADVTAGRYFVDNDPMSNRYRVVRRQRPACVVVLTGVRSVIEAWLDGYKARTEVLQDVKPRRARPLAPPSEEYRVALQEIVALDFKRTATGSDDFYSGPGAFIRAWTIAAKALGIAVVDPTSYMHEAGQTELASVWSKLVDRAKQLAKPEPPQEGKP